MAQWRLGRLWQWWLAKLWLAELVTNAADDGPNRRAALATAQRSGMFAESPDAIESSTGPEPRGPLELLVLQPTPFCNINCSYCYLPDRQSTRRMSLDTLDQTFRWVFESGLVREPFTLLWHAGEPLVLPVSFYEVADDLLRRRNVTGIPTLQSFQTNATLLDAEWCAYLRRADVHLGVSVDGPHFLHDR